MPVICCEKCSFDACCAEIDAQECLHVCCSFKVSLSPIQSRAWLRVPQTLSQASSPLPFLLFTGSPCYDTFGICFVEAQHLVDDAVAFDGVGVGAGLGKGLAVDLAGQVINKFPLQRRTAYGCYLVLGVGVEVEADSLALGAVSGILQGHG